MKKNIIAVCDTEGEYACNFAEYLNSRKKVPFEAEAFTDVEKLCTYAGHNPPEILLIAEGDVDEQIEKLGAENVILLSEEKQQEQEGHKTVYKYQSAESVIQEVMAYYVEHTSPVSDAVNSRKLDMIGIYSPVGRCSKTLFALTAGQILGEEKQVLYLNMEDYSGFETLFHLEGAENLTDFFYRLRCQETLGSEEIPKFVKTMGKMDYIPPAVSPEDIREIQFSEWIRLFELLRSGRNYETVLLDVGNSVEHVFQILGMCRCIYVPVLDDWLSRCKMMQFRKIMENCGGIEEKIREIRLPICCPNVHDSGFVQTLVWGQWGSYVRKVLKTNERK
nr:hypothetical protein [uncultured Blautia sp.]